GEFLLGGLLGDLLLNFVEVRLSLLHHPLVVHHSHHAHLHHAVVHHPRHRHALVVHHAGHRHHAHLHHAVHGLLIGGHVGFHRLLLSHAGLVERLLNLLGGVHRIDLVRLQRGLILRLLALLLVELGLDVLGGIFEFVSGVLGLLAAGHRHVHGEVVLGAVLLHVGVVDLVGRLVEVLGGHRVGVLVLVCQILQLLRSVLGRRLQVVLLLGDVAGLGLLRIVGGLVGGLGHVLLFLRQFFELVLQLFEFGDVLAALFDGLGLRVERGLG